MKHLLLRVATAMLLGLTVSAGAQTTTTSRAGIGDSDERPVGAWMLPAGVELARPITGYSLFMPDDCAPPEEAEGSGDLVRVCIALRFSGEVNGVRSQLPIAVEIPAGLMLISEDLSTQNGIILKRIRREIRPGQTIYIPAYAMCLNDGRSGSSPGSVYTLGPVLNDPGFNRLFRLLEDKRVPREGAVELQTAVWALSEGGPIPGSAEAYINALPRE